MLLGSGAHALAQVLPGGLPSALRAVGLHAAAGPPVLAPAPGDEPAYPRTPAAVAQPHFGSRGCLLSAAVLFAVSRGVRHDLTGAGGGSPRQTAAQDETDPRRCLPSVAECPATVKGWLVNEPLLAGPASGLVAERHFSFTLCLNEARQVRPQASVSDRRSGTEGVKTPRRRDLSSHNPSVWTTACSDLDTPSDRFVRWDLEYLLDILSMALDDRNQYPSPQSKAVHHRFKQ